MAETEGVDDARASGRPWPARLEVNAHRSPLLSTGSSDASARPHAEPLTLSSVWSLVSLEAADAALRDPNSGFAYRRDSHPNALSLANKLAALHGAAGCVLTAQGMSAIAVVAWSLLRPGSEVWLAADLYGKTRALFTHGLGPWQIFSRTFNPNSADDLERLSKSRAELVIVETITNPRVGVTDVAEVARRTHAVGGRLMVDNTFASHLLVRPLSLGADLCMESLTKIVSGHSDSMLGMVCGNDSSVMQRLASQCSLYGLASSPLDCYLTNRGLATLPLRLDAACKNALALAERLSRLDGVMQVDYPGLETHAQHPLACRQLAAFGWMLCVELHGGQSAVARAIAALAPEIPFCPSLGDVQTTVSHPSTTSHRGLTAEERGQLGISDGMLRISCGAEPTAWLCDKFCSAIGQSK